MSDDKIHITVRNDQWLANGLQYLVGLAVYCLIGWGVDYWLFIPDGALTDWTIPSTYLVIAFWPLCLFWQFLKFAFWIALAVVIVIIGIAIVRRGR